MKKQEFEKLNVGDKVRVTADKTELGAIGIVTPKNYNTVANKVFTVKKILPFGWIAVEENGFRFRYSSIEKLENTIIIKSDGKTVTATMGGKKAEANCNPDDTFDLHTGAKLALERLFKEEDVKPSTNEKYEDAFCWLLKDIFKYVLESEKAAEQKEKEFVPYIHGPMNECYGTIGTPTKYKDKFGKPLFVGDIVELYDKKIKKIHEAPIVEADGKQFVMGIEIACNGETGAIEGSWKITKKYDFSEVEDGKELIGLVYVKNKKTEV